MVWIIYGEENLAATIGTLLATVISLIMIVVGIVVVRKKQ